MNNCITAENMKFYSISRVSERVVAVPSAMSCTEDFIHKYTTHVHEFICTTISLIPVAPTRAPLRYATWGSLYVSLLGLWWLLRIFFGFAVESPADVSSDESGAEAVSVLFDSDQQNTVAVAQTPSRSGEIMGLTRHSDSAKTKSHCFE